MKIIRTSPLTGQVNVMDIPVTEQELRNWQNGALIQYALPNLTPDEREFIMTGMTPEEWAETFGGES